MGHQDRVGTGLMLASALPARLCELVPAARGALAHAAVDAFRAVPWIADMTRPAGADPSAAEYSPRDFLVGGEIVGDFLPYRLIYRSLDSLLRDAVYNTAGSRSQLEHCGSFMAMVMTHDMDLKEPLTLYLREDIDKGVANALARVTVLGQSSEFLDASGADPARAGFVATAQRDNVPRLLRCSSLWDAPRCFLKMIPEVVHDFSSIVTDAVGKSARESHQANGSFDLVHAIVGRQVRDLVRPEILVREVVAGVIDAMFHEGAVREELIRDAASSWRLRPRLTRNPAGTCRMYCRPRSRWNSRIALTMYRDDGEFRDVLLRIAAQP